MLRLVEAAAAAASPPSPAAEQPEAKLALEAAYRALGEGCYELHDYVDFPQFCRGARTPNSHCRVSEPSLHLVAFSFHPFVPRSPAHRCVLFAARCE